jgi:hypothetical protein
MVNPRFVSSRETPQEQRATWGGATGWGGNIDGSSQIEVADGLVSPAPSVYERAVHSWPMRSGSGSTVVDDVGTADGVLEGAMWESGEYVGGSAIEGAGTGERVDLGTLGRFGSEYAYRGFSFAVTLDVGAIPSGGVEVLKGIGNSSSRFVVEVGNGWTYGKTGHPLVLLQDSNQDTIRVRSTQDIRNKRTRILLSYSGGSSVSAMELYVDGENVTEHMVNQAYSGVGDFVGGLYLFGEEGLLDGVLDNPVLFDGPLSPEEAMIEYTAQPWS